MDSKQLREALVSTGRYETSPTVRRSVLDRLLGGTGFWYYRKVCGVVLSGCLLAKRGKFDSHAWGEHSAMILTAVEECGGKVSITGFENVSHLEEPVVFVANHMSMAETFLLPGILLATGTLSTVVKESLTTYPLFGSIMRAVNPVVVGRKDPRTDLKEVLTKGAQAIREGRSVLVFPQATRNPVFDAGAFNSLGVKLAAKAGVKAVPLALKTDYQGIGKALRDFGPVDMSKTAQFKFGPQVKVEGNGRAAQQEIIRFITENLRQWGVVVKEAE